MNKKKYQSPMDPWPSLEKYSKEYTLEEGDLTLFYFEAGKENPQDILLIHGLGDEADTWRHVFEPLAEKYHLLAVDLPGFGRSDKPNLDYSPQFFISTLNNFIEELSINKPILMGSSLGAILSQGFALQFPEKVSGLILLDGGMIQKEPMLDWSLILMQIPLLGEWLYNRLRKDPDAAFDSIRNVYYDLDSMPEKDRDFLYRRVNKRVWSDGQRRAYFSTLRNLVDWVKRSQEGLEERLGRLDIPTLVILGEHDHLFPEENADAVIKAQINAEKVIIDGAGHLPQQETPQAVIDEVLGWLDFLLETDD